MIDKQKAIEALETYKSNFNGSRSSVGVQWCIEVIREIPEDDEWAYIKDIPHLEGEPFPAAKEVYPRGDGMWFAMHRPCWKPLADSPKDEKQRTTQSPSRISLFEEKNENSE